MSYFCFNPSTMGNHIMTKSKNLAEKTLLDSEEKPYIIEHLNEEHQDELIGFAELYLQKEIELNNLSIGQVNILEIYQQGVEINVTTSDLESTTVFIQFPETICNINELQNQYIALIQQSDKSKGKDSIKLTEQSFILKERHKVSKNMLRLVLSTNEGAIKYEKSAGYAYLFELLTGDSEIDNQITREHCYYTLRKVFKNDQQQTIAWVDVYQHSDKDNNLTNGSFWATSLQLGSSIKSKREFPEKIEHLSEGQALLIADETSLPTVARLLEVWNNPTPPIILNITNEQDDQTYLTEIAVSKHAQEYVVFPLVIANNQSELAEKIDTKIDEIQATANIKIEKVWGAMEAKTIKKLRRLLRDRLALPRANCVLKVYWREE